MSENVNTVEGVQKNSKNNVLKNLIYFLIGVVVGIVIGYAIFASSVTSASKNLQSSIESSVEVEDLASRDALSIPTYLIEHKELNKDESKEITDNLFEIINNIITNNTYVQIQSGEDYFEGYLYNEHGECFAKSSDNNIISVFRDNTTSVKHDNENGILAVGKDIDIMRLSRNVLKAYTDGVYGVRLLEMLEDEHSNNKEYRVDLYGTEAVLACYNSLGSNFANTMLASLKDQLNTSGDDNFNWVPHLIFSFIVDENNNLGIYCNFVLDGEEYTSWMTVGYIETETWKLSDEWYASDFTDKLDDNFNTLINELESQLNSVLNNAFEVENNEVVNE